MVPLHFSLQNRASVVSEKNSKMFIHLTTGKFSILPQSILNWIQPREDCVVELCTHMGISFCMIQLLTIVDYKANCAHKMISESSPEPT